VIRELVDERLSVHERKLAIAGNPGDL
jgi:hypothetical protein